MKPIRTVQIGTWWMTHSDHTMMAMRSMPQFYEVLGICEPNPEYRARAEKIDCYKGLKWLELDEIDALKPDAIMIEGHELDQAKLALPFAELGYNLHIEKPGGDDSGDFSRIVELAKQNNTILQLGYMYRYNPAIMRSLEIIRSGKLGDLVCVEAQMSQCYGRGMLDKLGFLPGGMFFYLGCHLVDLLYLIMGEPKKITPMHRSSGREGTQALDSGMVLYEYERGISMLKTFACEVNAADRRYLMISGTKGTIEIKPIECWMNAAPITNANHVTMKCVTRSESHPSVHFTEEAKFSPYGRYDDMLIAFAKQVAGIEENPYSPDYEMAVHELVLRSVGK